mgnify:CR=1 FL=1
MHDCKSKSMVQTITIDVSEELGEFIGQIGENSKCSKSEVVKMLLMERVRELEEDETHQWVPADKELEE